MQLNCSPNTITGTIYCDPAEYIDPMNINEEECARKWSGSVSISCGSVNITGNDGNCSNNHPPRFSFDVNFGGCPDNCCPSFGLYFILLYENCGSFSSNNGELQQILSIPSDGIIYITGDFYDTDNPGLVDNYAYFSVIGDGFSESEPYPGSFGTGWSAEENYTRLRSVTAGENIYIQADYNTTFSSSRCLRIWFAPSQE